jgi:TonB-dependent starch-binding outer membrane protein SusC
MMVAPRFLLEKRDLWRSGPWSLVLLLGFVLLPGALAAQQPSVSGTVVNTRTGQGVANVQVGIQQTGQSTLTDAGGRFRFDNVRAEAGAQVTLRVVGIGYRVATHDAVVGGPAVRIDLSETAVDLEQIVVTGTPGGTARRAIGNTVTTISVDELQALAPSQDFAQLMRGRASNVSITPSSGMVGSGGRVRIRGVTSLSLDSEPLIYIDGVRIDNSERGQPTAGVGTRASVGVFGSMSRLADIDVNQIESIEIIKGPAAATLYGTEASNGVIQIITKRGAAGRAQFTAGIQQGASWVHRPERRFPTFYRQDPDGSIFEWNSVRAATERGEPFFRTGHIQRYDAEISGGSDVLRYYSAASHLNEEGINAPNQQQRYTLRSNLQSRLSDKLDVSVNLLLQTGRLDSNSEVGQSTWRAYWPCMTPACHADGTGFATQPSPEEERRMWEEWEDNHQYTGGATVTFRPWGWFTNRLSVGIDQTVIDQNALAYRQTEPRAFQVWGAEALGVRASRRRMVRSTSIDYAASATANLRPNVTSQSSFGFQYYNRFIDLASLLGQEFPAPGVSAINAAARITGNGTFEESATVGTYVQQQFGLNERLFVTGAIRADDNSAFGEEFELVLYPKLSGTWVVSEEPFWGIRPINTLRLRAAYGESGKQPASFAAMRVYRPIVAPGGTAGVAPASLGNPELGPERGREFEGGFDASIFDDRIAIEFTAYDKRTVDAILNAPVPPSLGFAAARAVNIGEVRNSGFETSVTGRIIRRPGLDWDLTAVTGRNANVILDLGGLPALTAAATQQHREGFPIAAFFGLKVVSADVSPAGVVSNVMCDGGTGRDGVEQGGQPVPCAQAPSVYLGKPMPTWEGSFSSNLTIRERFSFYALVDYQLDAEMFDWSTLGPCVSTRICRINIFPEDKLANPVDAGRYSFSHFGDNVHPDRSYFRLRQVSGVYRLTPRHAGVLGATSGQLTVSVRNLPVVWRPTGYRGVDPDVLTRYTAGNYHYAINFNPTPVSMQFVTAVRLSY